jgi:hypothetical protein
MPKMKKLIIASALSAAFVSPAVFAQAKNFEGFGLQLSTGYQNNEVKGSNLTFDGVPLNLFGVGVSNSSKGEMPLNIGVSYTFALTERFTLGALVEYNPLSMNTGTGSLTFDGIASANPDDSIKGKLQNQVSISLVPGYAFTDSTMGYARVGWINATAKASPVDGSASFSKNTNGAIFGLGAKHMFTKNIYGFAEATYATYGGSNSSVTNEDGTFGLKLTPTSYSFLVGVGIRF